MLQVQEEAKRPQEEDARLRKRQSDLLDEERRITAEKKQREAENEVLKQKLSVNILRRQLESSEEDTLMTPLPSINVLDSVPEGQPFTPIPAPNFATSVRGAFSQKFSLLEHSGCLRLEELRPHQLFLVGQPPDLGSLQCLRFSH